MINSFDYAVFTLNYTQIGRHFRDKTTFYYNILKGFKLFNLEAKIEIHDKYN